MIELARIQNKYLTQENILLKEHIVALKGIIRKLEDLLRSMCGYPLPPPSSPTKKNGKDRSCDGDTIPGNLPQAWKLPRGVPIPM